MLQNTLIVDPRFCLDLGKHTGDLGA